MILAQSADGPSICDPQAYVRAQEALGEEDYGEMDDDGSFVQPGSSIIGRHMEQTTDGATSYIKSEMIGRVTMGEPLVESDQAD